MTVLDGVPFGDHEIPPEPPVRTVVDAGGTIVQRLPIDAGQHLTRWYGHRDGGMPVCWSWPQVCAARRVDRLAVIRPFDTAPTG